MAFYRLVLSILVILIAFIFQRVWFSGELKTLNFHHGDTCSLKNGAIGAEDMEIIFEDKIALITSDDRRSYWPISGGGSLREGIIKFGQNGSIKMLNFEDNELTEVKLKNLDVIDFHPHGIGSYQSEDGKVYIGVVNHQRDGDSVEIFIFEKDTKELLHLHSISHDIFRSINDIVLLSPNEFIVSTWLYSPVESVSHVFELLLTLPFTYVSNCRFNLGNNKEDMGIECHKVIDHKKMANGIGFDKKNNWIYVADSLDKSVTKYEIKSTKEEFPKTLEKKDYWSLSGLPDNIMVMRESEDNKANASHCILVAGHPKMLTFMAHQQDQNVKSPSQVFKLCEGGKVDEILLTDGNDLSASAGVALFNDKLIVGGVLDDGVLICDAKRLEL